MLSNQELFKKRLRWKVGTNKIIKFWGDVWCDNCNLIELLNIDFTVLDQPNIMVSEFINPNKKWNTTKLASFLPCHIV